MLAATYHKTGDIRLEQRQDPVLTDDNLIVEIRVCAVCGTDLKIFKVGNPRCTPPRIIGHELVGTIIEIGKNIKEYAVGERITMATTIACRECTTCAAGLTNMCPNATPISYGYDGAFAEYMAVPPSAIRGGNVIRIPDSVPDESAALAEPLSCVINAQRLVGINEGDTVVILGGGPMGAISAELAKAYGAGKVIISQRSEPRLTMLRKLDGVIVVDGKQDLAAVVKQETGNMGADVVIVCAPTREAQELSIGLARKGGRISLFASLPKGSSAITFDSRTIHYNELRVVGASDSRPEHVQEAIDLMNNKKIDLSKMVTHHISLDNFMDALQLMDRKECLKVLVYPKGPGGNDETEE